MPVFRVVERDPHDGAGPSNRHEPFHDADLDARARVGHEPRAAKQRAGSVGQRLIGTVALIGAGSAVYFVLAWVTGGMDREDLLVLLRRKKVEG